MQRIVLFIILIFCINCDNESKTPWDIKQPEFKHTESHNYSENIMQRNKPAEKNVENKIPDNQHLNNKEPLHASQSSNKVADKNEKKKESSGLFSFLFNKSDTDKKSSDNQTVCEDLLDINKIVVSEQNEKMQTLTNEKKELQNQINKLNRELQQNTKKNNKYLRSMEIEIERLNDLIRILSTEIK